MKEKDIRFFKDLLTGQLEELVKGAGIAVSGIKESGNQFIDPLDRASFDEEQTMHLRIKSRESNLIRKIKASLERIEEGTYGICESCGKEIPLKRMMVRPVTNKCIECKIKEESYEKVAGI
ncbi:MAG: RNA polymerase-binding protein DksA [Desulfobacterales bacterium]